MALPAIPDELLAEVFIRLPTPDDVIRASRVCVSFRRVVADRSFLRRFRKLHAPPLLGFLTQRRNKNLEFHPTFVPYPSTSVANAVAFAADFSFSFLPARDWALCDIRDGRVLLANEHRNSPKGSFLTETVVCDPLHRRYLLLPPIPDDLVTLVEGATLIKHETFLLPPSSDDDDEDTSFRVIWIAMCQTKMVAFVFSSSTGQWRVGPSRDLFLDVSLSWAGEFFRLQYANGCFYWLIRLTEKLLVLDTRRMEFSSVDAPPGTKWLFCIGDIAIAEEKEDMCAMFMRANDTSYLKYIVKRNRDGSYGQWDMVKRMSLYSRYFFIGSMGRYVFLYKYGKVKGCFSLDIKTFQLERVCASVPRISETHTYSNFPPSLLSTPTVSSGTQEVAEGLCLNEVSLLVEPWMYQ